MMSCYPGKSCQCREVLDIHDSCDIPWFTYVASYGCSIAEAHTECGCGGACVQDSEAMYANRSVYPCAVHNVEVPGAGWDDAQMQCIDSANKKCMSKLTRARASPYSTPSSLRSDNGGCCGRFLGRILFSWPPPVGEWRQMQ